MNKSILLVLVAIAAMLTAGNAIAAMKVSPNHNSSEADEQWKPQGGGAIGQNWSNAENWWHNAVPTGAQKAKINRVPGPIISGTVDVNEFTLSEGNINTYEYPSCTAVITGDANVNVRKTVILSYYTADRGKLQIDGGTTTVKSHMFVGRKGNGELTMNGGTLNVLGNFVISFQGGNGSVKLNGGTLHIKQLTYEWPWQEKVLPNDPNVAITPGVASLDISGGQIVHDSNARDCNAVAVIYRTMAAAGKLTAYNGQGDAVARINPVTHQVNVTGQIMLWDYSDITVTSHSTMDNDANRGIDRMFKSAVTDPNAAVFLDGPGVGGVYTVEWETPADGTVNSIEMIAERDSDANHFRAVRHFTLKAKIPSTSPTYNVILYDGDVSYTTNVYDLIYTLPAAQTASKFRAEFTGNDAKAVRIRELNAIGTRSAEHLWNLSDISLVPGNSSIISDPCQPGAFAIGNMFENRRIDNHSTIFTNGTGAGYVYNVVFRPTIIGEVHSFEFVAEKDANSTKRAVTHFKLKAKSVGLNTYDKTLYDGNVAPADYNNNVYRLNVNLAPANYVTAQEFRAEFTGGTDVNGVRIRELNALGVQTGIKQLWEPDNIVIGDRTQYQIYAQRYDIDNAFQKTGTVSDPCSDAAAFEDLGADTVYYVEWKTRSNVVVDAFHLLATHDSPSVPPPGIAMGRAMKHFKLKAKSVGSSTYNLTLYDADVAVPYNAPYDANVLDLWVNLASPVTTSDFRAEFTGNDAYGVRINELDAIGTIQTPVGGDMDSDTNVDFKDFAAFANNWRINNSSTTLQTLENFESYSSLPATWANWLGQTSSSYNFLYLETTTVHGGSKGIRWTYSLDPSAPAVGDDRSGIVYTLSTPVNLKNFGKFRVWINRKSTNSLENYLGVRFYWAGTLHDSRVQAEAKIMSENGSTKTPAGTWSEWVVDLSKDLLFTNRTSTSNNDIYNVGSIVFYVCNELQFVGSAGTIYMDDVALTTKCPGSVSDFNGDCKVDFKDLKVIADNWLKGF